MVHNGIEYADMQLIAESYDLLRHGVGLEVAEIAEHFKRWNETELESFLIEITARSSRRPTRRREAAGRRDPRCRRAEGDRALDGPDALERGVPLTGITEAVFARTLSALKSEREAAEARLASPKPPAAEADDLAADLEHALYASKIISYAQGFAQMAAAADGEGGTSTSARWPRSGAAAASSGPGS